MSCNTKCYNEELKKLKKRSGMENSLYDKQEALNKCIEGFGSSMPGCRKLLKWILIAAIVYLVLTMLMDSRLDVIEPTLTIRAIQRGGSLSVSEFDIVNNL
jgi:hypothetical protein